MAQDDFDCNALARYLHLSPTQVSKLAERDKIPGRKVSGQWRFSEAEIHHWMEHRMGVLEENELLHVENALERSISSLAEEPISVSKMLPLDCIAAPLNARTRSSAVSSMAELAMGSGLLWDPEKMTEAIRSREELFPTALENGVALLHPRRPLSNLLGDAFLALGITSQGIPFGGSRGSLTDIFFLICSTDDHNHLRVLARISRLISDNSFLDSLRSLPDAKAIHDFIAEQEMQLPN